MLTSARQKQPVVAFGTGQTFGVDRRANLHARRRLVCSCCQRGDVTFGDDRPFDTGDGGRQLGYSPVLPATCVVGSFLHFVRSRRQKLNRTVSMGLVTGVALMTSTWMSTAATGALIQNLPSGISIRPFGVPDSQTYGQVFTAPITGTLTSFTLHLDGAVGALHGAVGRWNGSAAFGFGFGESANLYTSGTVASTSAGPYTFTPNIGVLAGQQYVAYLSVFGEPATSSTSMPLGSNTPGVDYFVWNNSSNPQNNPTWNYFANFGDALFSASITPVPEPSSIVLLGLGAGIVGVAAVRRRARAIMSGPTE